MYFQILVESFLLSTFSNFVILQLFALIFDLKGYLNSINFSFRDFLILLSTLAFYLIDRNNHASLLFEEWMEYNDK